jgi:hypothetical protein
MGATMSLITARVGRERGVMAGLVCVALVAGAVGAAILLTRGKQASAPLPRGKQPLFAPGSVWNKPLSNEAALDPRSATLAAALAAEARHEGAVGSGPWISTDAYSTPIYRVPANQRPVRVALDDPSLAWRRTLQAAFEAVPIPPRARPAAGTDGHMTIWQPATDKLWEFFQAGRQRDGWHAAWGGAIERVSRSPGYYTTRSWPGAEPYWGATATSLPVAAGVMTLAELRIGRVDHALALNLPYPRAGVFSWPAQRSDGTGRSPRDIPEGAHLRIDPKLDLAMVPMPRLTRIMAVAAQRYGMIVRDQTHRSIGFFGEDPTPTGTSPYYGKSGFFDGKLPAVLLATFPWGRLQVLKMQLHAQAP